MGSWAWWRWVLSGKAHLGRGDWCKATKAYLNVVGRGHYYISESPVDLRKGHRDVRLRPASLVQVHIVGSTGVNWKEVVLLCESSLGPERARLEVLLTRDLNGSQVMRYASFLVPRERVHLRLWHKGTGRVIAMEDSNCVNPNEFVVVRVPSR